MYYNNGLNQHRFSQNPLEVSYAVHWNRHNPKGQNGYLDYMLAKDKNHPCGEVTERDRVVAATVIQWLGSPCGQSFIRGVQGSNLKKENEKWI